MPTEDDDIPKDEMEVTRGITTKMVEEEKAK